ncbi:MAG: hypothetical protein KAX37_02830 [Opitutaceae bacterium]|nr:hypothetical protein [Opitutaceae bacterium]
MKIRLWSSDFASAIVHAMRMLACAARSHAPFRAVLALGLGTPVSMQADSLRIGTAAVDITPPVRMPFQVPQRPPHPAPGAEGTHDPLHAKTVVFEDGGTKAAIVACDVTSLPLAIIEEARKHVEKICGVPPANVMITSTHSHTGPNLRPRFFKDTATREQMAIADRYLADLPGLIAESVKRAEANLAPARLHAACGRVDNLAYNRRYLMKDGRVYANPAKGHDEDLVNVVREAGTTDPSLPLVYLDSPDGKPLASLVNFSMHLDTTGGLQFSADFAYELAKILADVKGPEMLTHFTIGAAGNINHYYLLDPRKPHRVKGYGEAARIGALLAAEVVRCYQRLQPLASAPLKVSHEIVRLKLMASKSRQFEEMHQKKPFFDGEVMETYIDGGYTFPAEVMVITLGDELAFVGVPGELFVELGLQVKMNSPYKYTFLNELANGAIGYIPTRRAMSEGAYGASPPTTRNEPGNGEALVDSAIRQLIAHRAIEPTLR